MDTILIVEDDDFIREILVYSFNKEDFTILQAANGNEAIKFIENDNFDIALLDVMLPDMDGFTLCKKIASKNKSPVIMLTAKNDIDDKLLGLDLGADDYITKPFDIREVIARVKMILRRYKNITTKNDDIIELSDAVLINRKSYEVTIDNKLVRLKPKEFDLLLTLAENRNMVLSRQQLLEKVWGYDFEGDSRTVDVHVQRLRKKLGDTKDNSIIKTIFGVGYKIL
ncbi:response regulator transcription factor [Clostridiaceae bacterium M8S5]|nr:response regulator transcription factor [Clostridiaceae bacterium M8S5]